MAQGAQPPVPVPKAQLPVQPPEAQPQVAAPPPVATPWVDRQGGLGLRPCVFSLPAGGGAWAQLITARHVSQCRLLRNKGKISKPHAHRFFFAIPHRKSKKPRARVGAVLEYPRCVSGCRGYGRAKKHPGSRLRATPPPSPSAQAGSCFNPHSGSHLSATYREER
ncbi:hypothetical protein SY28_03340 [Meiothermus taiwanensis]|nr:hypothetical protein SY28_03340 [Meiothermus taiwanensis]